MSEKQWETDEDRMIFNLTRHKNLITLIIKKLKEEGIPCKRTTGNDSKGDILVINPKDEVRVKEIIREIQDKQH